MTDKYRPEILVRKHYVIVIDNDEAYKIAKEYDEDEIKLEVEYMNEARNNGIPVPEVIEITDEGMILKRFEGELARKMWDRSDLDKKKNFILSFINTIKKLPRKGNLCLIHKDLDLQNIFVNHDGEITSIIDWKDCEYLPQAYIRAVPSFLSKGNSLDTEADREVLTDIFYKSMGKLSKLEELIISLSRIADGVEDNIYAINNATLGLSYMGDLSEEFETAL